MDFKQGKIPLFSLTQWNWEKPTFDLDIQFASHELGNFWITLSVEGCRRGDKRKAASGGLTIDLQKLRKIFSKSLL